MSVALAAASVATDCAAGGGSGNGGCGCGIGCGCGGCCFRFARQKIAAQRLRAPAITRAAFRVRWAARTLSSRSAGRARARRTRGAGSAPLDIFCVHVATVKNASAKLVDESVRFWAREQFAYPYVT